MPSIKDVAQAAGVSTATVSRVLANKSRVNAETRKRVLEAIEQLNYRPNLIARSLRVQKSAKIGLVVSDIRNPFFTAISRAVEDAAYEQGYSDVDMVLLDNVAAAYELTTHLIENGYRNFAGLFGNASTTGKERSRGFQKALKDHQLSPIAVHFIAPRIKQGYETTMSLLAQNQKPDAIFTSNSLITAGTFQAIRASKLSVPGEVALVGFDETTWGALVDPPITIIAQPTEEIGRTATELLFQRITEPGRSPKTVILKGKLLQRGSSAPR